MRPHACGFFLAPTPYCRRAGPIMCFGSKATCRPFRPCESTTVSHIITITQHHRHRPPHRAAPGFSFRRYLRCMIALQTTLWPEGRDINPGGTLRTEGEAGKALFLAGVPCDTRRERQRYPTTVSGFPWVGILKWTGFSRPCCQRMELSLRRCARPRDLSCPLLPSFSLFRFQF
jgi:hypothetical protein